MAIAQRGATTTAGTFPSGSLSVNKPTGVVAGDRILIKVTSYDNATYNAAACTGFTNIGNSTTDLHSGVGNNWVTVLERIATGSEGTTFTVTQTVQYMDIECTAWSGTLATGSSTMGSFISQTSGAVTVPGVTVLTASSLVLIMFSGYGGGPLTPATWTSVSSFDGTVAAIFSKSFNAGATGTVAVTGADDPSGGNVAAMLLLEPLGGGAAAPVAKKYLRSNAIRRASVR